MSICWLWLVMRVVHWWYLGLLLGMMLMFNAHEYAPAELPILDGSAEDIGAAGGSKAANDRSVNRPVRVLRTYALYSLLCSLHYTYFVHTYLTCIMYSQ